MKDTQAGTSSGIVYESPWPESLALFVSAVLLVLLVRRVTRGPRSMLVGRISIEALAVLSRGSAGLTEWDVWDCIDRGWLWFDERRSALRRIETQTPPKPATPQHRVLEEVSRLDSCRNIGWRLRSVLRADADRLHAELMQCGLLVTRGRRLRGGVATLALVGAVWWVFRLDHFSGLFDRAGWGSFCLIVGALLVILTPWRTARGDQALRRSGGECVVQEAGGSSDREERVRVARFGPRATGSRGDQALCDFLGLTDDRAD